MSVHEADVASPAATVRRWKLTGRDRADAKPQNSYAPRHAAPDEDARPAREQVTEPRAPAARTFFRRAVGAKSQERQQGGATGQQDVARRLAKLETDWKVLHAVPAGVRGRDIDHVVIGPAGVFVVAAKIHSQANVSVTGDTVTVNGSDQPHVHDSRHEAARTAVLLSAAVGSRVDVHGIVAVVGADRGFTVEEQPRCGLVTVVSRKQLLAHLRELPEQLDAGAVARIHDAARRLPTWQSGAVRGTAVDG